MLFQKVLVFIFACLNNCSTALFCFWNTGCPYKYFASETPYDFIRGDIRDSYKQNGCQPVSIWGIYKHGHSYPELDCGLGMQNAIMLKQKIIESKSRGQSSLCSQDVENLRDWQSDLLYVAEPLELTELGRHELFNIGKRLKEAFSVFFTALDKDETIIRPSHSNLSKDSAKFFLKGFGHNDPVSEIDTPHVECEPFDKGVRWNSVDEELNRFYKNVEYLSTKDRIQRRTGILYDLTHQNITALYNLCRYFSASRNFSPWCAIFTTEDLQVLEYEGDLKDYYKNAYGSPDSAKYRKLGSEPLKNLLKSFQLAKNGSGKKLTAYFTDSTMMDMIYTALGLFRDSTRLTGAKRVKDRQWRTSFNSPFAANLVAVLNKCTEDGSTNHNVAFFINEQLFPSLCNNGLCSWEEFEKLFTPLLASKTDNC